jgi:ankyrin repeat protein
MFHFICGTEKINREATEKLTGLFQEVASRCVDYENDIWLSEKNAPKNKDHFIATETTLKSVEECLIHGADPNAVFRNKSGERVPLISYASKTANPKLVKLLLSYGSNPNIRDSHGRSCVGLLLSPAYIAFASDERINPGFGDYILNHARKNLFKREETLHLLLEAGLKSKIVQRSKETPIHNLQNGDVKGVMDKEKFIYDTVLSPGNPKQDIPKPHMMEYEIRVFDKTEVFLPTKEEKEKLIKTLVERGFYIDQKDKNGYTPLHLAIMKKERALAQYFLENGADVNARSHKGITPLHICAHDGNKELLEMLLQYGANLEIKDKQNRSSVDFARHHGHHEIEEYLKQRSMIKQQNNPPHKTLPRALCQMIRKQDAKTKEISF